MAKFEVELNEAGIRKLLKSKEMAAVLRKKAQQAQSRCGRGYTSSVYTMPTRVIAKVTAVSRQAVQDNEQNNTILKALR